MNKVIILNTVLCTINLILAITVSIKQLLS